jgi:hypothetical protein
MKKRCAWCGKVVDETRGYELRTFWPSGKECDYFERASCLAQWLVGS